MKSASSFSNTWIRETIRRNRIIPAAAFIAYFVTIILPVLLNYNKFEDIASYSYETLHSGNIFVIGIDLLLAVAVSVMCFSWLHSQSAVIQTHAMPATRTRLFWSTAASGLIMILIPLVLTAVCMLGLHGAHTHSSVDISAYLEASVVFTPVSCLKWLAKETVIILFVYAFANLAAVIAGNHIIHVLLACFLNALPVTVVLMVFQCIDTFWYGYRISDYDVVNSLSPVLGTTLYFGPSSGRAMLYGVWIITIVIVSLLSVWIYNKAPLERVRSACFFPIAGDVISILLTIIGSTFAALLLALITWEDSGVFRSKMGFLAYMLVCSVVIYLICRMIADSSLRVFNLSTIRKYGICLICLALFSAFTVFDLAGISTRVSSANQVASVTVDDYHIENELTLTDPELIDDMLKLQKAAIETRNEPISSEDLWFPYRYRLKNGKVQYRSYPISSDQTKKVFRDLLNSDAYKQARRDHLMEFAEGSGQMELVKWDDVTGYSYTATISRGDRTAFIEALIQDLDLRESPLDDKGDYEYLYSINMDPGNAASGAVTGEPADADVTEEAAGAAVDPGSAETDPSDMPAVYDNDYRDPSLSINLRSTDKHALAFLKDHGYLKQIADQEQAE